MTKQYIDYGFEVEFFAAGINKQKIFNATKLIKQFLKLDLIESKAKSSGLYLGTDICPALLTTNKFKIVGDGTAFEVVTQPYEYWSVENNHINEDLDAIVTLAQSYVASLFGKTPLLSSFVSSDSGWEFIDPGVVYNSGKTIHNAYTETHSYPDKKEETENGKKVSFRAAGFHIHIGFPSKIEGAMFKGMYAPKHCNNLVRLLDNLYDKYFPNIPGTNESLRNEKYATKGNYRIKYQSGGYSTLEYRQLSNEFFLMPKDKRKTFFKEFHSIVKSYCNSIKLE